MWQLSRMLDPGFNPIIKENISGKIDEVHSSVNSIIPMFIS